MFKQKFEKQILAFLPFASQNDPQQSNHEQNNLDYNFNQNQHQSQDQYSTPYYNQVEQESPLPANNHIHEEKYNLSYSKSDKNKNQEQKRENEDKDEDRDESQKTQSRIDYSLYERLRGGNAIEYADLIRTNDKAEQPDFFNQYRDSGISFLQNQLNIINSQNRKVISHQPQKLQNHDDSDKSTENKKGYSGAQNTPLLPIYKSFYIAGQQKQIKILLKWRLVVQFLKYEYMLADDTKIDNNQEQSKFISEIQTQNYRGSWPNNGAQNGAGNYKNKHQKVFLKYDTKMVPLQIIREIQKLQQKIQPFNISQRSNKKEFQKHLNIIAEKLLQNQKLHLERINKQEFLTEKYRYFLQKVKKDYENNIQNSLKQYQNVTGKRIRRVSTQVIRTQRLVKQQFKTTYDGFFQQIRHIKCQIQKKGLKHQKQLNQIKSTFQDNIIEAFQSLKEAQKLMKQKKQLLQEKIQILTQKLNKNLQHQINEGEDMMANIKGLMLQILNRIQESA